MAKCPVCENEIDEAAARAETGQTAFGATEVDPAKGTRRFHDGKWYYFDFLGLPEQVHGQPGCLSVTIQTLPVTSHEGPQCLARRRRFARRCIAGRLPPQSAF